MAETMTEQTLAKTVSEVEFRAGAITISNDDDYSSAAEFGRMLKAKADEVKSFFKPMKDAAYRAHKEICGREKAMLKPLDSAEKILKRTMGEYVKEQERKRLEREKELRDAAMREVNAKMDEAVALENVGDDDSAAMVFEEAAIMEDAAYTMTAEGNRVKAAGVMARTDWEIIGIDASQVPVALNGVEIRPVDTAAVMRLIRASKGQIIIPGITFREKVSMTFRK